MSQESINLTLRLVAVPLSGGLVLGLAPMLWGRGYFESADIFLVSFVIGVFLSSVVGLPLVLMIDRFFGAFRWRYVLGGLVCAIVIFILLDAPIMPKDWHLWGDFEFWGRRHVARKLILFSAIGLVAGGVYSGMVSAINKFFPKYVD
ncbi:hypothetical protein ABU614_10215 [Lysobacter firmicutimachus]|uniref:Uncharacterized protein n=1 Tax=Lysobacter firmicutimachus TaxID=1792846 RepID=A0AAU8MY67_9GAMM